MRSAATRHAAALERIIAISGAALIALAVGSVAANYLGFTVGAVAVLGFWYLIESIKRGV